MSSQKLYPFRCLECGSSELIYRKYPLCTIPVIPHENGIFEYLESKIDEDDYMPVAHGFTCGNGHYIYSHGKEVQTESELHEYLEMTPEERECEWQDYCNMCPEEPDEDAKYRYYETGEEVIRMMDNRQNELEIYEE